MNLKEFMQKLPEEQVEYDFTNEITAWFSENIEHNGRIKADKKKQLDKLVKQITEEKDPIRRFLYFKLPIEDGGATFDCDSWNGSCSLTDEIYSKLWGYDKDWFTGFGGDTMNSFWSPYKFAWQIANKQKPSIRGYPYNSSINDILTNFEECNKELMSKEDLYKELMVFASRTHSIGNYVLVQNGFNGFRGVRLCDRWDYSLEYLKNEFGRIYFYNYVRTFFLNDYVAEDSGIVDLSKADSSNNKSLESDRLLNPVDFFTNVTTLEHCECELIKYLQNVNKKIFRRGERIVNELQRMEDA